MQFKKSGILGSTALGLGFAVGMNAAAPARALIINPTFDSSITSLSNAAQVEAAINYANGQYQTLFNDPITINITFKSNPGTSILGQSNTSLQFTGGYAATKGALAADSKSADDATAIANLPVADPTGGKNFIASFAEAKALGLRAANNAATDGTVTLGAGFTYTYDPNNRAVSGAIDFIGVVEHEVSEVMGRIGILGNTLGTGQNLYDPLDLFGYTGPGALNLLPNQNGVNFSINGGATLLKLYNNGSNGGDNKDWASGTNDSYNAFSSSGVKDDITPVDVREMDVIGYDLVTTPEPASMAILAFGGLGLLARRRRN